MAASMTGRTSPPLGSSESSPKEAPDQATIESLPQGLRLRYLHYLKRVIPIRSVRRDVPPMFLLDWRGWMGSRHAAAPVGGDLADGSETAAPVPADP